MILSIIIASFLVFGFFIPVIYFSIFESLPVHKNKKQQTTNNKQGIKKSNVICANF